MGNQEGREEKRETGDGPHPPEDDLASIAVGWSAQELESHRRMYEALYRSTTPGFESTFNSLRQKGVPGSVIHRIYLFGHYLSEPKQVARLGGPSLAGLDLDAHYEVLGQLTDFDPDGDEALMKMCLAQATGGLGGAAPAALMDPRVQYAMFDQFERARGREISVGMLLRFFHYMEEMSGGKRRKFIWALFQVHGRMYPGRLLKLGMETAQAMGTRLSEGDLHSIEGMLKLTPREYLSYAEFVAWWKLHDVKDQAHLSLRHGFTLIPFFQRLVRGVKAATVSEGRDFAGKVRLGHDSKGIMCEVSGGLLTLRYKERPAQPIILRGSFISPDSHSSSVKTVVLQTADGTRHRIKCSSMIARNQLMRAVRSVASVSNRDTRFGSFHSRFEKPVSANWFVDGTSYYETLMQSLLAAKEEIFIAGWSFQPEVYLFRGPGSGPHCRLDNILRKKAREGVKIYILLWWEVALAVDGQVDSQRVGPFFQDEPNIQVLSHPLNNVIGRWSHHQKCVVVDRQVAYLGGIDLCFGRYDTQGHPITDENHLAPLFPGKDYYNPCIVANAPLDQPFVENLDRTRFVRLPWHDVQVQFDGNACAAVAANFAQRWNMVLEEMSISDGTLPLLRQLTWRPTELQGHPIRAQTLRSLAAWSGPESETECSIMTAYIHLIESAEHFLYIENQYFISSLDFVSNEITAAIVGRIGRAIEDGHAFRVVLVMPLHSEGPYNSSTPRLITVYTQQTFMQMDASLREQWPEKSIWDYMSVHYLMNHAVLNETPFLSMVYVHSKMIMADDRMAIVGTANINDRSMLGDRDSEIAVFLESVDEYDSTMDGKPWKCSKMLWEWRMSLWREHLGENYLTGSQLADPVSGAAFFSVFSEYNQLLAQPIINLNPQHIWRSSTSVGLPHEVPAAVVQKMLSDWLQGLIPSKTVDLCNCCKHVEAVKENVCVLCEELLCDACCNTHDSELDNVAAPGQNSGRKDALHPIQAQQMRKTLKMAKSGHVICDLCLGHVMCPHSQHHSHRRGSLSLGDQTQPSNDGDFKIRHLMQHIGLPTTDDVIERFRNKCYRDRSLVHALLSEDTAVRLNALRGHIFAYPMDYVPKVKPDLISSAAPKELFV